MFRELLSRGQFLEIIGGRSLKFTAADQVIRLRQFREGLHFCPRPAGPLARTIATLMTNKKVRFVANEKKKTENSPDYFVKSGRCDLGVAWNDVTEPDDDAAPLEYISVKLDGTEMVKPINAALFHRDGGADLVWSRPKT